MLRRNRTAAACAGCMTYASPLVLSPMALASRARSASMTASPPPAVAVSAETPARIPAGRSAVAAVALNKLASNASAAFSRSNVVNTVSPTAVFRDFAGHRHDNCEPVHRTERRRGDRDL